VWCDWQVRLCDPHLSALEVRFSRRCTVQIDVYLTVQGLNNEATISLAVTPPERERDREISAYDMDL